MKLNKESLKSLIMEVLNEDNLVSPLREEQIGNEQALEMLMNQRQAGKAYTVAFVSAANPPEKANEPNWDNEANMAELERMLQASGAEYAPISGTYFNETEPSFIVFNRPKAEIIAYGKKFRQDSIIWGEKVKSMNIEGKGEQMEFLFHYFELEPEKGADYQGYVEQNTRDVVLNDNSVQAREDMFSRIGPEKVVIPFFVEPEMEYKGNVTPVGGVKTVKGPEGEDRQVRGVYEVNNG